MVQYHSDKSERREAVSNQNEIDDILNELKRKRESKNNPPQPEKKTDDFFYSFTPPKKEESTISEKSQIFNIDFDNNQKKKTEKNLNNNFDLINDSFNKAPRRGNIQNEIFTSPPR